MSGDVEGAAAFVGRILLPVEIGLDRFGIERRAVVEFDAGPQLEGPGLEVVRMGPGQRELRLRLALVVEMVSVSKIAAAAVNAAVSNTPTFSGSKPGISSSRPTVMLPPCFCALAGPANKAMPNAATRKFRASARERIPLS
jgi:hypothetical protein